MKPRFDYRRAVALEYGNRVVPVVSAKAEADQAQHMIEEAMRQGVHLARDPQLVSVLAKLDMDEEIPREVYSAVAVILSWVYWLKGMRSGDERA